MSNYDYQKIGQELVRAVRGNLSQERVSQRLGYKSNPLYRWENGSATVGWDQFLDLCEACRRNLYEPINYILGFSGNPRGFGFICFLLGTKKLSEIAQLTHESRFAVAKWKSGDSSPSLEVILKIFAERQFIMVEFIEALLPQTHLPSLGVPTNQLVRQRQAVAQQPEIEAILASLSLKAYKNLARHQQGFIASLLGISPEAEQEGLSLLEDAGAVIKVDGKYVVQVNEIDTTGDATANVRIRTHWLKRSIQFLQFAVSRSSMDKVNSNTGYFLIDASDEAADQIMDAYYEFCLKLRAITTADVGPKSTVKLCSAQIIDLLDCGERLRSASNQKIGPKSNSK